jgi:hypothetical protein
MLRFSKRFPIRRLCSTKEGVGETSGQTAGSSFEGFALRNRSGRRNRFSSFGADLWSAISSGPKPAMKSGPDVFADALVPRDAASGVSEDAR